MRRVDAVLAFLYYKKVLFRYSSGKKGRPVKTALIYTETEHCIKNSSIDPDALRVVKQLRDNGCEAYIVGGAVRDLLLNKEPKDFDLVTDARPAHIKKIFRNSRIIGKRFRLVHIFFGAKIFELTTFRSLSEGTVGNAFGTMEEDVRRRDFTLNALYYDPIKRHIIDYVGGVKDIKKRKIVPIIPLKYIFIEDPVRILRALKYAVSTGFSLPFLLERKIRTSAHLLAPVSPSRITEELLKIINSGRALGIISRALETGLYIYLQPSAASLVYADAAFKKRYLASLASLDELVMTVPESVLGAKLVFLIFDFVARLTDWEKEEKDKKAAGELYAIAWRECRSFVLPMNPQRTELEYAVRLCLKKLGVFVRVPKKNIHHFESGDRLAIQPSAKSCQQ